MQWSLVTSGPRGRTEGNSAGHWFCPAADHHWWRDTKHLHWSGSFQSHLDTSCLKQHLILWTWPVDWPSVLLSKLLQKKHLNTGKIVRVLTLEVTRDEHRPKCSCHCCNHFHFHHTKLTREHLVSVDSRQIFLDRVYFSLPRFSDRIFAVKFKKHVIQSGDFTMSWWMNLCIHS